MGGAVRALLLPRGRSPAAGGAAQATETIGPRKTHEVRAGRAGRQGHTGHPIVSSSTEGAKPAIPGPLSRRPSPLAERLGRESNLGLRLVSRRLAVVAGARAGAALAVGPVESQLVKASRGLTLCRQEFVLDVAP